MWLLIARRARPEMPYWPGRRLLAAIDALAWPLAWLVVLTRVEAPMGLVRPVLTAVIVMCAASRLWRAMFVNHEYGFTTWRWGKVMGSLILIGLVVRLTSGN